MAGNPDNFDFDNLDDFDSGISESDFGGTDNQSNDFGGFDSTTNQVENTQGDKKAVMKTAIIAIIIGLVIIASAFMVMRVIQGKAKQASPGASGDNKNIPKVTENVNNGNAVGNNNNEAVNNASSQNQNQQVVEDTSGWKAFTTADNINFNTEYVDSIFTVTNIKNYVKIVDSESNLIVKTILTGSLSGFIGTYELELPYSKGSQLLAGNSFKVKVQLGKFNNKVVVGEIKY